MSRNMKRALGRTLATIREETGLTQEVLAEHAGVGKDQPSRWENGHRWPDDPDIAAYSEATGVPVDEIWARAAARAGELALTQHATHQAVRAERRSARLQQRSRRRPPPKENPPRGD